MPKLRKPGPTYVKQSAEIGSKDREELYEQEQKLGPAPEEDVGPVLHEGQQGQNNAAR